MLVSASSRLDPSKLASLLRDDCSPMPGYLHTRKPPTAVNILFTLWNPFQSLPNIYSTLTTRRQKFSSRSESPFRTCRTCVEPEVIISISSHLNSYSSLPTLMIQQPPTSDSKRSHVVIKRMLFSLEVLFKLATSFNHLETPKPHIQTILDYSNDPRFFRKSNIVKKHR